MKYDIILNGKNEFNINNTKIYKILKIDNIKKENKMIKKIILFIKNQNNFINDKHYIGIDLEYNKVSKSERQISLMQINIENNNNIAYIFILYPPDIQKKNLNIIKKLLTHKLMIKILHGGESLDIPYLFNQLLIKKTYINNFCSNFYDTKFLCDYKKLFDKSDLSCSIYTLLLKTNIINQKKYDELDNIEDILGPIYLINIDIYKLDENLLKYALYDVIFLPELVKYFININDIYKFIIPEISNIINKYKRNIEINFINLEKYINKMNTFYIKINSKMYILNTIWKFYYDRIQNEMNILKEINYFKNFFKIITKFIIYSVIYDKYTVYMHKDKVVNFNFYYYYNWLNNYKNINNLLINYKNYIDNKINDKIYNN